MAQIKIPEIRPSGTIEGKVDALYDAYFVMRKFMTYYLSGNLDEENVVRAQEAVIANVLAGTIKADQIDVTEGKILAAQIETLTVGDNVEMGPNATISWSKVTERPSIPSQYTDAMALDAWENSDYATYIDANGVYSGSFNGGMFNVNPTGSSSLPSGITIGGYYGSGWIGQALQIKYEPGGDGGFPGTVFSSSGDVPVVFGLEAIFESYVRFRSSSDVDFQGSVDFTGATVTGLGATYKFG
jgi:hypothetical protein